MCRRGRCHSSVEFGPGWAMRVGYPEPCRHYSPCWGEEGRHPKFRHPHGWCCDNFKNEKEFLLQEKEAVEKYLEALKKRLEELENEESHD